MGRWYTHTERWLSNEHREQEAAADEAFAQVLAALPAVVPSPHFVRKTVHAAWQARKRRQRSTVYAALAASLMGATATGVAAYGLLGEASGWLIAAVATAAASSAGPVLVAATGVIDWWTAITHTSGLLAGVVGLPQSAAVLLAIEVAGGAALYALHRLLRAESGFRNPGPLCL